MTQLTVWGHERAGTGTVLPWMAGTRPLHAGTRRSYCMRAQTRGLASRAKRNGRWDDDLPTQGNLPEK